MIPNHPHINTILDRETATIHSQNEDETRLERGEPIQRTQDIIDLLTEQEVVEAKVDVKDRTLTVTTDDLYVDPVIHTLPTKGLAGAAENLVGQFYASEGPFA